MRLISISIVTVLVLASLPAMAQMDIQHFDVPETGYTGTDTFSAGDLWNQYIVHVVRGHELKYSFEVLGNGEISVSLIPGKNPNIYSEHYISFSTSQPVTRYSDTFPAVIGFDRDYSIVVNSSHPGDVQYTVSIRTEPVEPADYTLHYILIVVGLAVLVIFSYRLVLWQEKREKEEKRKARRGKKQRR